MAAILNSTMLDSDTAILDSDTFLSSLRFTSKHSPSTLTLTQTNSIWLTWWWQPSWILPSWILAILDSAILHKTLSQSNSISLTWWWQPSWILPCWIETPCFLLSDSLKNTLMPLGFWLKLIQPDSNSFFLTQLDDGSHLEIYYVGLRNCHLGLRHLHIFSQTWLHGTLPPLLNLTQTNSIWLDLMMADILNSPNLNSAILDSAILQKHSQSS